MDQSEATIVRVGQGRQFRFPAGNQVEIKASADTGMRMGFMRTVLPPGTGMPLLHVHRSLDEAFQILEGSVEYKLGELYATAAPGDAVLVPPGVPHCFRALGEGAVLMLMVAPANGIDMIEELSRGNLMDPAWTTAVLARYDTELLETRPHWAQAAPAAPDRFK